MSKYNFKELLKEFLQEQCSGLDLTPRQVIAANVFVLDCSCDAVEEEIAEEIIIAIKHIKGMINVFDKGDDNKSKEAVYYRCIQMAFFENLDYGVSIRFPWWEHGEIFELDFFMEPLSVDSDTYQNDFIPCLLQTWEDYPTLEALLETE